MRLGIFKLVIEVEKLSLQEMFKEIDAEDDEIVYQRDLIVYLKCVNGGSLEDRKVKRKSFLWLLRKFECIKLKKQSWKCNNGANLEL